MHANIGTGGGRDPLLISPKEIILKRLLAIALLTCVSTAQAASFDTLGDVSQEQFKSIGENIAAATQYKGVTPAEPLGILGFDVGLGLGYTSIEVGADFDEASGGEFDVGGLPLPRVSAHKGLPFGIDVGASVAVVPSTDIRVIGAELKYAILKGGITTPAIGLRAGFSRITGVDQFDMQSMGLDVSISKGFLILTPYAGVGIVRTTITPNDIQSLTEEEFDQQRLFVGLNVNLGLNWVIEADKTDDFTSLNAKVGLRF